MGESCLVPQMSCHKDTQTGTRKEMLGLADMCYLAEEKKAGVVDVKIPILPSFLSFFPSCCC